MRKIFIILSVALLAACAQTPHDFEKSFTFDSLPINDGVCTVNFSVPQEWFDAAEYDQVVFDLDCIHGCDEVWLNGKFVGRTGFVPEDGEVFLEPGDRAPRRLRHYYVSKSDLAKDNTLVIKTDASEFVDPLKIGLVHRTIDEALMTPALRYNKILRGLEHGWNSWDTRSIFTQLFLPETYAIKMALKDGDAVRDDLRIGNPERDAAVIWPYDHTFDGTYSECDATWHNIAVKLQTSSTGDDLVMLVTPLEGNDGKGRLVITPGFCWPHISDVAGGEDCFVLKDDYFYLYREDWSVAVKGNIQAADLKLEGDHYTCSLAEPVLVTVGPKIGFDDAAQLMAGIKDEFESADKAAYGDNYDAYHAMQTILAWDTIFDPDQEVVVTPVSRNWNPRFGTVKDFGGYVLFDWDTFFASQMLSVCCKELAYANAVEVTSSADKLGFVPKDHCDHNSMTEDQSQPPVGSLSVWNIYQRTGDKWFLELLYDRLLAWNRWWLEARQTDGLLCWGSNRTRMKSGERDTGSAHNAILESGLDNSPMYDGALLDAQTCQLNIQDVGLTSMYVMDCDYLIKIAKEIGRKRDVKEIAARGAMFRKNIQRFWCEEDGMFYNINTDTGEFNKMTSATNFYVLLAKAATPEQARRVVDEHLLNEDEYWGEWILPMTPRNTPEFNDQDYWRGRIWGPTNYLVYAGLCNYDFPDVRKAFAEKSNALLMKDWTESGYIYENWNAITGDGGDRSNCDAFYHWGALMAYIYLDEMGQL